MVNSVNNSIANHDLYRDSDHDSHHDSIIFAYLLIFFGQFGYSLIDNSYNKPSNNYVKIKYLITINISLLLWIIFSYGFAFGKSYYGVIGASRFGTLIENDYKTCLEFWLKGLLITNIVNISFLNRCKVECYVIINIFIYFISYPIITHWIYNDNGWLNNLGYIPSNNYIFLISGLLCMVSQQTKTNNLRSILVNYNFFIFGNILTWISIIMMNLINNNNKSRLFLNILLASSISAINSLLLKKYFISSNEIVTVINGFNIGLLSINNHDYEIFSCLFIGLIASLFYVFASYFIHKSNILDPFELISVNLFGGIWGIFSPCFFDEKYGLFYGKELKIFGIQFFGFFMITIFNIAFLYPLLIFLKKNNMHYERINQPIESTISSPISSNASQPETSLIVSDEDISLN